MSLKQSSAIQTISLAGCGRLLLSFLLLILTFACSQSTSNKPASNMAAAREAKEKLAKLRENIKKIVPFFAVMGKPGNSDWLASHNEPGQTFAEYLDANPTKPTAERSKIYVLPLGTFNAKQRKLIAVTAGYLAAFYNLNVQELPPRPLIVKPPNTRLLRYAKVRQVKTGYILNEILRPMLPADAGALIAFTGEDLFTNESMNYVFGQASLEYRVGVWSLSRLDDNTDEQTFLLRTLKIAAHEAGHMFSMRHCTKYECLMSGTNHLAETDRRPVDACPECTAKICWLTGIDQTLRYERLATFMKLNNFPKDAATFLEKANAVK